MQLAAARTNSLASEWGAGIFELKKICKWAAKKNFTHLVVLNEKAKKLNAYVRGCGGVRVEVAVCPRRHLTRVCTLVDLPRRVPVYSMYITHLPNGPTGMFKLSSSMLGVDIPGHGRVSKHIPEIILNGFTTRLGHRIGRLLGSMFPHVRCCPRCVTSLRGHQVACVHSALDTNARVCCPRACITREQNPEFRGRRVVTFHNQRDFIFIRQHRYMFTPDFKVRDAATARSSCQPRPAWLPVTPCTRIRIVQGAKLQELGPRFTLKPRWLQAGTFNTKEGEYEWMHKRHEMDTTRRRFHL